MSHGDRVTALAPGFAVIGASPNAPFAITADPARHFYAVQFHPEVHHTVNGARILRNFTDLAGFTGDWTMAAYKDQAIAAIRAQVGDARVICGLSGGVDCSVAAVLIHEAIGDQLTCVFVDTGLMRQGEAEEVVTLFRDHYNIPLIHADESRPLPRRARRRHRPGDQAQDHRPAVHRGVRGPRRARSATPHFLAQGTLYPDVIESVSFTGGPSVTIKSHHNVGGLPERMHLKLVEPLRELFKDEVRALGRELGLPDAFVGRHPFPGPGLAIRCPGEITRDKLAILRQADAVYLDQIRRHGLYDAIWQAFAVLLPVRTVGVMGDGRTYDHVCALRAVTSVDGMTADYYPFDHGFLGRDRDPDHQRGQGHQPRHLRHHLEAAGHDRVGVVLLRIRGLDLREVQTMQRGDSAKRCGNSPRCSISWIVLSASGTNSPPVSASRSRDRSPSDRRP